MTFTERLHDLMIEKDINYNTLAKKTSIPVTTLSNYKNRGSLPSITQLSILADFFNCSIDYLVGREDDFGVIQVSGQQPLTTLQQELLHYFDKMSDSQKNRLIGYAFAMVN